MLKPFLLVSTLVLLLPAIAPGPAAAPPAGSPAQDTGGPKPSAAVLEKAKKTYAVDCSMCHGDNGNGKTDLAKDMALNLDDWTNPTTLAGKTDKQLFDIIRSGKDKMPAEDASRAKDDDVKAMIYYIRTFSTGQPAAAPAAPAADKPSN